MTIKAPLTAACPADHPPDLPIEVRPYAPGLLCMTIPAALILTADQAGKLVVQIHDAIEQLRICDAEWRAHQAAEKNGRNGRRGIAGKKRKS